MMQANELRIGNLVSVSNNEVRPVSCLSTGKTPICTLTKGCRFSESHFSESAVSPIPITEEWLLKFGWKLYSLLGCQFYMTDGNIELVSSKDGSISMEIEGQLLPLDHIKYVHQLQNLWMGLTGKELEVKS